MNKSSMIDYLSPQLLWKLNEYIEYNKIFSSIIIKHAGVFENDEGDCVTKFKLKTKFNDLGYKSCVYFMVREEWLDDLISAVTNDREIAFSHKYIADNEGLDTDNEDEIIDNIERDKTEDCYDNFYEIIHYNRTIYLKNNNSKISFSGVGAYALLNKILGKYMRYKIPLLRNITVIKSN